MDNKTWLWKKKSSEKINERERALELERSLEELNEQLSSVRAESNTKDGLLAKQSKVSEDALTGWQKAEAEALSLKQQLDDALLQKKTAEERVVERDATLKECMQQLQVVKDDQQFIVNNAALKISREQEKIRALEQRLAETNKKLTEVVIDNGNLTRMVEVKEQLLKELSDSKSKIEASLTEVKSRLDSSEKLNASLKYELCMLQKELEIRNEEREFNHRSSNAAHRQNLENIKKIAKLETECQRLRVMVRKRLPGPTAVAKMRNEVEMLNNNSIETRRKRSSSTVDNFSVRDIVLEESYDSSNKGTVALLGRLHASEDENKIIKESLIKKNSELQASRLMLSRTTTKLSHVEKQLEEFSKGQACLDLVRGSPMSYDLPLSSISENGGNDDTISCAESWASALISELEHFKSGKPTGSSCRSVGVSELSLMDDFVEMEKLAVVSVDKHFESSVSAFGDNSSCVTTKESCVGLDLSDATGKELVPIKDLSHCSQENGDSQAKYMSLENHPSWLREILRVIIQKHHIMQKSIDAILDEVRAALGDWIYSTGGQVQQSKHASLSSSDEATNKSSSKLTQSNLENSVHKLIELVEGIIHKNMRSNDRHISQGDSEDVSVPRKSASANGYIARAFLWESSELAAILKKFVVVCNELLHGKVDIQQFTAHIAWTVDWIMNHCFSLQDVSDMKEAIRKNLDGDELNSDNELKAVAYTQKDYAKLNSCEGAHTTDERKLPFLSASNGVYVLARMNDIESKLRDENEQLRQENTSLESQRKDLEEVLKMSSDKNEALTAQLGELEANISSLQLELAATKESKGQIEDQILNQKLINEDLGTQLSVAKAELKEAQQKFSSLEVELEEKSNCCEELEATCLELQLQIESASSKETPKYVLRQEEKQIQAECDIVAASEKLAACQETIVNLGKQLKALASPNDAPLFDKVISSPTTTKSKRRLQLVDHMRAEDHAKSESPNTKEVIHTDQAPNPRTASNQNPNLHKSEVQKSLPEQHISASDPRMLMLVPKKQKGGGTFLRKLMRRRREQ